MSNSDADIEKHGGKRPGSGGKPGNTNALTHGARSEVSVARRTFNESENALADGLRENWIESSPYPRDNIFERLETCAVRAVLEHRGLGEISKDMAPKRTVATTPDGMPIREPTEHYLAAYTDRLNDKIRFNLKALGVIGSEDTGGSADSLSERFASVIDVDSESEPDGVDPSESDPGT